MELDAATWSQKIDEHEKNIELFKKGALEEAEFRYRRLYLGTYGQRDGEKFMFRIKIPLGELNVKQLKALAEVVEKYAPLKLGHFTTRQNLQIHWVKIEDSPKVMRVLAEAGINNRESCGHTIRNICGDYNAGVNPNEAFDYRPYAEALVKYLNGHPDYYRLPRKFKTNFGAEDDRTLIRMHDMGFMALAKEIDGKKVNGFMVTAGGGLGADPHIAITVWDFIPAEEILRAAEAILQVFVREGNRQNLKHARIKFLIEDWGEAEFKRRVHQEFDALKIMHRGRLLHLPDKTVRPVFPPSPETVAIPDRNDAHYRKFVKNNIEVQKQGQEGYYLVNIFLPVGDLTLEQFHEVIDMVAQHREGLIYVNIHHDLALRWVKGSEVPALYDRLKKIGLHQAEFHKVADIVACPGKPTCGLAYTDSHTMGQDLYAHIMARIEKYDLVGDFSVRINGCPNSCAQHYTADVGLQGCERMYQGSKRAHYMFYLGGDLQNDVRLAEREKERILHEKVPSVLDLILEKYVSERKAGERFKFFLERDHKRTEIRALLQQHATPHPKDEVETVAA